MDKDRIWRDKLRGLTNGLGPIGEAVYSEIADAVDDRIDEAIEIGERRGEEYGRWTERVLPF